MKRPETAKRVAIIGMAFRMPGGPADSLWPALLEGRNLVTTVDPARWAQEAYLHPRRSEPGTSYTFAAGSIGDISGFDCAFFGISPREAAQMDPQQRILLELAWEAIESAGVAPSKLRGSSCGVYVGLSSVDYGYRLAYDLDAMDSSSATGGTGSIAANRISWFLDLRGPSMVIDTACSSSLVAVHQACQAIACGETEQALAGGISLHLHPYGFIAFSKASMLSKSGACRVFDAAGDGYVRSEGGGLFVLKDLEAAQRDGDPILAVVAASGVNAGGKSPGLTVPSAESQAALIAEVYARAGIAPADVDYLEAHGTGTVVGDPIEANALGIALGKHRPARSPLPIGSVKSNLGHLEAASGVAGLVKAVLCLKHRVVPPTIHLQEPNPEIHFEEWNLKPVVEPLALHPFKKLLVGVNSFGFGGANAHAILESTPSAPQAVEEVAGEVALVLTGHTEAALRASAQTHAAMLQSPSPPALRDLAYSAVHHRDWHAHRAIVAGSDREEIVRALAAFGRGENAPRIATGRKLAEASGPAFVYSGNGAQWEGMGTALFAEEPVFRDAVEHVDQFHRHVAGFSLAAAMRDGVSAEKLQATEIAQPLLFALQVGLTELYAHWGVVPTDVAGHSVGEAAAAWACGALSLEDAVHVVHHRSRLQARTRGAGAMTAVGLSEEEADRLIRTLGLGTGLVRACTNSPRHVTMAGTRAALEAMEQWLAQHRTFYRRLDLDYAFHSASMEPIGEELVAALRSLRPGPARIPFHSTVTGDAIPGTLLGAGYWWRNVRKPVCFDQAMRGIAKTRATLFVEIGPQPILRNYIHDCLRAESVAGRVLGTMERGANDRAALRDALHQVVVAGPPLDLRKVFPVQGRFVAPPAYPWQRERHWRADTPAAYDLIEHRKEHPLLGYRLHENAWQWENHLDIALYPAFADHVVGDAVVFPASGFVELALAASAIVHGGEAHEVEGLEIRSALLLEENASRTVRFALDPGDGRFTIRSRPRTSADAWQLHATGKLLGAPLVATPATERVMPARKADITAAEHYALATRVGLAYGPAFRSVTRVWLEAGTSAFARLTLPNAVRKDSGRAWLHPSSVDGAFQVLVDLLRDEIERNAGMAFVPVMVGRLRVYRAGALVTGCRVKLASRGPRSVAADFELTGGHGERIADLEGVRFRAVPLRPSPTARLRTLAYRAVPKLLAREGTAAPPASFARLAATCASRLHALSKAARRSRYYEEVDPLSDVLCAAFAERTVRALSANAARIHPEALAAGVAAEHRPLLDRLLAILEEDQLFEPGEDGWRWTPEAHMPGAEESWITLLHDYPDEASQLIALGRAGMRLADFAPVDTESLLAAVSLGSAAHANAGRALAETLASWLAQMPPERPLRILEIVSCRSEVSARVVAALPPDRFEYVVGCTNASALGEYEAMAEGTRSLEAMRVNLDEAHLGFGAPRGFDAIIVSDGLQGAANPGRALENLSACLADGGLLAILAQAPSRAADLLFGSDPAWWVPLASGGWRSRLCTSVEWQAKLATLGYSEHACVPELPGIDRGFFVVLARRDRSAESIAAPRAEEPRGWIVVQDARGADAALGIGVQAELRSRGHRVFEVAYDGEGSAFDFDSRFALARSALGEVSGIVCLPASRAEAGRGRATALQGLAEPCATLTRILETCRAAAMQPHVWLVTTGATTNLVTQAPPARGRTGAQPVEGAILWGFARTLANEFPDLHLKRIDCTAGDQLEATTTGVVNEVLAQETEDEVIVSPGGRHVLRLGACVAAPHADRAAGAARLDFTMPGPLKNLTWRAEPRRKPAAGEVEIEVRAAGLNFRDVMYAMGLLSDEAVETGFAGAGLGMELSGVVTAVGRDAGGFAPGDEVVAFAPRSFSTHVVTSAASVVKKLPEWSFEAAATLPTAFFTVYYALKHLARLREGEAVLIHGAAGGVGVAAIQVARWLGAKIFATAGSPEKRDFVRMLGADHVFDSRSLAFADEILAATSGQGVDVILNSLSGEAIERNLRVLRPFGRFLELGKRDFYENTHIGLRPFRNNISYFGIDADQLLKERADLARQLFAELMELARGGVVSPLPYRSFAANEAVEAFRHMQQSRQIGKIVLSFADGVRVQAADGEEAPQLALSSEGTYLVTGGLGGFGLKTAQWLAARGARHLVLVSRNGATTLEARAAVADLEALGVKVEAAACDVTDRAALEKLLARIATSMPPLKGVVHAAAVIEDGLAQNLTREKIARVLAPKVLGARHLDELTRAAPLDFFVLYSSATTLFGNPGQSSYVAANSYLEALAKARRDAGLPATCIAWGAIGDAGYLARNAAVKDSLVAHMGGAAMGADAALTVLEKAIRGAAPVGPHAVLDFGWRSLKRFLATSSSPRFRELATRLDDDAADGDRKLELKLLAQELGPEELATLLTGILRKEVGEILRIPPERLEARQPLRDLGMDSLMGMELLTAVEVRFGVNLQAMALAENPSIESLAARIVKSLKSGGESERHDEATAMRAHVDHVAGKYASELDSATIDELARSIDDANGNGERP